MQRFLRFRRALFLVGAVWALGFPAYLAFMHETPAGPSVHTDAIVVLTGMEGARVARGFDLLASGAAPLMLISGVAPRHSDADMLAWAHRSASANLARVTLGYEAKDTAGNAAETRAWLCSRRLNSIRLVTADYHMPRALWLMRRMLPDAVILPDPVPWPPFGGRNTTLLLGCAQRVREYNKYLVQHVMAWLGLLPTGGSACQSPPAPGR